MISQIFLAVFLLSIILHYLHGVECIKTKFYDVEPNFYFCTKYFKTIHESVYYVFHGTLWIAMLMIFFLLLGGNWIFIPLGLYGTTFFSEIHHFVKAVKRKEYYSGAITSFFMPIMGIFYWIELLKLWE
ncbi:MAG: hypothetical protein ABIO02_00095 [Patescibacteria group bacterium]